MIYHLLNSFEVGGTERQSTELILRLRERGCNISIGSLNGIGPLLLKFNDEIIPEYSLIRFMDLRTIKKILLLSKELKAKYVKILHCHDFYTNVFGTLAGRIARIPIIINSRRDMGDFLSPAKQRLHKAILKMATHTVVNSKAIRDKLIKVEKVPGKKVSLIYNGFDLPTSCYQGRTEKNVDSYRIGMMAHFNLPVKGQSYFLKAAELVSKKVPGSLFFLAGEGPLREPAERLAERLGIMERTHFIGLVPPYKLLKSVDLLVCPSLSEGLSNSIIEAMGCGVPVVATRVGGNVELIEDSKTGLLVDPANPEMLAEAVIWTFENPAEAFRIGKAGRKFIQENFAWAATCDDYQKLYSHLLHKQQNKHNS